MKFDLFIDGKVYNIELGMGKLIAIDIDGKSFQAETKMTSKGLIVQLEKQDFLVQFEGSNISVDGQRHRIEVNNLRRGRPSWFEPSEETDHVKIDKHDHKISSGEGMIHPPMPGRVISIKVKEGDSVKVGSPILVLEAMKMQNEVVSSIDGIVHEIRVSEGDLVESKDVLVVIGK
jgi:biotin carboxyl carrier protein